MENQIVCPQCGVIILNKSIIGDAIEGVGSTSQFILCECGEKITYWQVTAQLRDQKSIFKRFPNWFRSLHQKKG